MRDSQSVYRNLSILLLLAVIIAMPFVLRQTPPATGWHEGDPVLVIATPHNEAFRYEFERGFSRWHQKNFGKPVKIEWRAIGGTTEIMRYLASEYAAAAKVWWTRTLHKTWPEEGTDKIVATRPPRKPDQLELWRAFRATDDPAAFSARIDLFFGGGEFDHSTAFRQGLTVAPWEPGKEPEGLFKASDGTVLIPERISGETWRTPTVFGNAVSSFGICSNLDRLKDLGIKFDPPWGQKDKHPPTSWDDLADPVYFKQVGAADPTKSGSVAKAFEMMVHQKIHQSVRDAGFSGQDVAKFEALIDAYAAKKGDAYRRGEIPDSVPAKYQQAIERGWENGIALVQLIGANARYFTDSAPRVPIDVSAGDAATGMVIDFFGRYQSQISAGAGGKPVMTYLTPVGGSSASCDPISLLRGAGGHADNPAKRKKVREVAKRFIQFTLCEDGQKLWCYRPGEPGGPEKFALRRLPIRRDFYPSDNPAINAKHLEHLPHCTDNLADPAVDPYQLAQRFTYWYRWSGQHFGIQRDIIRVMCMDAGDELREAWDAIRKGDGPEKNPAAMQKLREFPTVKLKRKGTGTVEEVTLTWRNAPDVLAKFDRIDVLKEWTIFYRNNYRAARELVGKN